MLLEQGRSGGSQSAAHAKALAAAELDVGLEDEEEEYTDEEGEDEELEAQDTGGAPNSSQTQRRKSAQARKPPAKASTQSPDTRPHSSITAVPGFGDGSTTEQSGTSPDVVERAI